MNFNLARKNMVVSQIKANQVTNLNVIDAFEKIPRELFVPKIMSEVSYNDDEINFSRNRSMMRPMLLAKFFQELDMSGNETILHIGANTGYASAVLSELSSAVISIESDKRLYEKSINVLSSLGIDNVVPLHSPMENGFAKEAPFDIIFIEGAIEEKPFTLFDQLTLNGKLATIIRPKGHPLGKGMIFNKNSENKIIDSELFDAQSFSLQIFRAKEKFIF